jgi:hypothetical protein
LVQKEQPLIYFFSFRHGTLNCSSNTRLLAEQIEQKRAFFYRCHDFHAHNATTATAAPYSKAGFAFASPELNRAS